MTYIARSIAGSNQAEDIVATAVLNAWRGRDSWTGEATVKSWLIAIAKNTALDHLRREGVRPQRIDDVVRESAHLESLVDRSPNPEQQAAKREVRAIISEALGGLPCSMRIDVGRWLTGEGFSAETSTAKVNALRARTILLPRIRRRLQLPPAGLAHL